jgi:hypothetical protein
MPGKAAPAPLHSVTKQPVENDALVTLPDWWRQIDRWLNEGGADLRQDKPASPQRERDST